jgi:hypothetical protein
MAEPDKSAKKLVRSFTAFERELQMLETLARYHGLSKSGTITSLIKKEFWRVFPAGTEAIQPEPGARIRGGNHEHDLASHRNAGARAVGGAGSGGDRRAAAKDP